MRIRVDLGGTKTEAVALGIAGEELARLRIATPPDGYDSVVRGIAELVAALETQRSRPCAGCWRRGWAVKASGCTIGKEFTFTG
jgi:predicted NBD/HSP70 family sugar kinase